ncbi:histamine H3 receptor-like [Ambystoma mexicanum]|uniref:histamine H3 receptor-like n=1 Tax=Ambystoma mexicanum TaxID=8296 RepID=UPI0037E82A38
MDSLFCNTSEHLCLFANSSPPPEGNGSLSLTAIGNGPVIPSIITVVLISFTSVTAVLGNTLVIVAFIVDKRLRTHSCYYLLNLAICDFFLGSISMPWYIAYTYTGRWSFGKYFCKMYCALDATLCSSSVNAIVLISYDRFLSVTKAVSYRALQGTSKAGYKAFLQIGAAWVVAFMLTSPLIILWDIVVGYSTVAEGTCTYEYEHAWHVILLSQVFIFYCPLIAVAYFNCTIYWNIRQRNKNKLNIQNMPQSNTIATIYPMQEKTNVFSGQLPLPQATTKMCNRWSIKTGFNKLRMESKISTAKDSLKVSGQENISSQHNAALQSKLKKDEKVAKSLAVIVIVFCTCWSPSTLTLSIRAICQGSCVSSFLFDFFLSVLWLNSSINPLVYPLCHKKIRRAFKKVLLLAD